MKDASREVDAYIARSAPFARPILEKVRRAFHLGCPEIEERIKWGVPSFEKDGMVGGMAAFKAHATFGFWRGKELDDPHGVLRAKGTASFMAEKLTHVSQVPPEKLLAGYVRRAVELNAKLAASPGRRRPPRPRRPEAKVPPDLAAALRRHAKARSAFEGFSPSHRREYVEWIVEAKREETRRSRIATAIDWLSRGRSRNWKYER
jgi:uncharacterized protein YdeI (YjbR/CyaY-like superfamily)